MTPEILYRGERFRLDYEAGPDGRLLVFICGDNGSRLALVGWILNVRTGNGDASMPHVLRDGSADALATTRLQWDAVTALCAAFLDHEFAKQMPAKKAPARSKSKSRKPARGAA